MKKFQSEQAEMFVWKFLGSDPRDVYAVPDSYAGKWRLSLKPQIGARPCGVYTNTIQPNDLLADANETIRGA